MKRPALWILLGLLAVALVGLPVFEGWMRSKSGSARAEPRTEQVRWFAAASLSRVAEQFSRYHPTEQVPGVQIEQQLSAGSSSQLAQQLIASDETGVFLSADRAWVDALVEAKRVDGEPVLLARNRLVWIAPRDFGFRTYVNDADFFRQLNNPAVTVALADDAVPAGRYAKAWLESRGQWNDSIRMARMGDVTSVLGIVSSGAALLGCVYASDVTEDARVDVVYAVDPAATPGIEAWGAVLSGSDAAQRAALDFCVSPVGQALFEQAGFAPAHPAAAELPALDDAAASGSVGAAGGSLLNSLRTLATTLRIALVGVGLVALPAIGVGLFLARRRGALRTAVAALAQIPLVLPPIAVGLILLQVLPTRWLLTPWAASIAAGVMAFPLIVHSAASAFEGVDPRLECMGASLGLGRFAVLRQVTLPLASHGLVAALLLGFGRAVGEFGATMLVAGNVLGETRTLALSIWQHATAGEFERAQWPLALSIAVGLASVWMAQRLQSKAHRAEAAPA